MLYKQIITYENESKQRNRRNCDCFRLVPVLDLYIANDIWNDFKDEQINTALQSGYEQGVAATVNQTMTQAENKECKAFSIYTKDKSVEVINTKCLQTATENAPVQK